jgi:hypothetical protein
MKQIIKLTTLKGTPHFAIPIALLAGLALCPSVLAKKGGGGKPGDGGGGDGGGGGGRV